ncbi:hypothetical protein Taro_042428 [Colocasia esculenta]|uniref:ENTH domain-containing protein n=1 Tax=Colocasia esculenta TaxID=4460 RepID=A0A843WDY7_COLES|nr:hypothetical protein [Colocasia esculenta]
MTMIWKRTNDTGKNWRHVYKGLTVLEYLVAHGSEYIVLSWFLCENESAGFLPEKVMDRAIVFRS